MLIRLNTPNLHGLPIPYSPLPRDHSRNRNQSCHQHHRYCNPAPWSYHRAGNISMSLHSQNQSRSHPCMQHTASLRCSHYLQDFPLFWDGRGLGHSNSHAQIHHQHPRRNLAHSPWHLAANTSIRSSNHCQRHNRPDMLRTCFQRHIR